MGGCNCTGANPGSADASITSPRSRRPERCRARRAKKAGAPTEEVFTNVHNYGNISAATAPVAGIVQWHRRISAA
jgi:hypothetical protein